MSIEKVKVIGITGGIGAGKSVVSRILRLKGYEVYDCDYRARLIMEEAAEVVASLKERYGEACYHKTGKLDRRFLAQKIFADVEERLWVNALVHSAVRKDIESWIASGAPLTGHRTERTQGAPLLFVESAILQSSQLEELCDEVWLVEADEEIRISRALGRGGIDETDLRKRLEAQEREFESIPEHKLKVIDNSGKISLLEQIEEIIKEN